MRAGKHVLCEKLMAHSVAECKLMCRVAEETGKFLSIGHQRHYSILYDNAVNLIKWGLLGELHHIRAQWHRNNRPGNDSWAIPIPGGESAKNGETIDKIAEQLIKFENHYNSDDCKSKDDIEWTFKRIAQWKAWDQDKYVQAQRFGYENIGKGLWYPNRERTAIEEMVRWRLWDRTGGGLMAELGSHQLDAASIFISALAQKPGEHVHPLSCLLYTSPSPRDQRGSRMPSSA